LAGLHFGPLFLEIRESDFGLFLPIARAYGLLLILKIKKNIFATPRFEQISLKVGKKRDISLFPKAKIF